MLLTYGQTFSDLCCQEYSPFVKEMSFFLRCVINPWRLKWS